MPDDVSDRRSITMPSAWWTAFSAAASKAGVPLSEWIGRACRRALPRDVRELLGERRRAGRPPKPRD